ncbi:MAG TPA: YraN family protein [Bryobacteraceae bacterium]|nr:YraN family protein [Bryobacteraceae bacterium]
MIGALLDSLRYARRRREAAGAQASGRRGEDLAHRYLQREGFVIVARNYRLPSGDGEADLIAWDGDTLVLVEVKSRESAEYGPPDRAIGPQKLDHMARVARAYSRKTDTPWDRIRFDVIAVLLTDPPRIEHIRNVRKSALRYSEF